jgi:dipeptidyl aminopeptidase/acylaminoacyl peptidase
MKKVTLIVIALLLLASSGLGQRKDQVSQGLEHDANLAQAQAPAGSSTVADPAIAYRTFQGNKHTLNVMNADGSNQTKLYTDAGIDDPSWAPDGSAIAFENRVGLSQSGLWRIDVAVVNGVPQGSNARLLAARDVDCGACGDPAWSPLGQEIAVAGRLGEGEPSDLFVIDANTGAPQSLFKPAAGRVVNFPAWRADGSQIAFVERDWLGANFEIKILDRATLAILNTVSLGQFATLTHLDWARNQDTLAFVGDGSIYTLDLPAGSPSFVIDGSSPSFSPDDALLVFNNSGVKTIPVGGGTITSLAGGEHPDWRRGATTPPPTTGSVAGTVTDASTAMPISGATVQVDTGQSDTTDTNGDYTIINVPTGTRSVTASAAGFDPQTQTTTVNASQTSIVDFALNPSMPPSAAIVECIIYQTTGGRGGTQHLRITIQVVDDFNNPVGGAGVSISVTKDGSPYGTGSGNVTNGGGFVSYQFNAAPSGCYVTNVTAIVKAGLTFDGTEPPNGFQKGTDPSEDSDCRSGGDNCGGVPF